MDFHAIREALRQERARLKWSLDTLAEKADTNRASIHSIENLKREPDLKPKLATIVKLAEAMEMTVSLSLEPKQGLQSSDTKPDNTHPPADKDRHAPIAVADATISRETFDTFLDKFGSQLQRSLVDGIVQSPRERKTPARPKAKPKSRAKNRKDARRRA